MMSTMRTILPLLSGMLFGFGLALSQMMSRQRVLGFLDVSGYWDPTLLLVMCGAAGTTMLAFRFVLKRRQPVCDDRFVLPTSRRVDKRLVFGALLFGLGWGISGYCPGPGLSALVTGSPNAFMFVVALVLGSVAARLVLGKPKA